MGWQQTLSTRGADRLSLDFTLYGGDLPRLSEVQFFSEASIRAFGLQVRGAIHPLPT